MEDFFVFKTKLKRSNYVLQNNVEQKGESFHFRADFELANNIKNLSKELDQTYSKVIKDILEDFFLEQKLKEQEFEPDWDKSDLPN